MALQVPAIFHEFKSKPDKTWRLTFFSNELNKEEVSTLSQMVHDFGWLIFGGEGEQVEIPKEPPKDIDNDKTPAQRLRAVLYVLWKQTSVGDFETFYRTKVEAVIEHIKAKLDK